MLLPSAGNLARLLAAWDAGSVQAFVGRMNAEARSLGMDHTFTRTRPGSIPTAGAPPRTR
jgi:D-alanyl-D-alanine carboxypeptidase (penicillin-binding protein 5/6)